MTILLKNNIDFISLLKLLFNITLSCHIGKMFIFLPMIVSENYRAIYIGGLSNKFYRDSVMCFREQNSFVLKTVFFSHSARHV